MKSQALRLVQTALSEDEFRGKVTHMWLLRNGEEYKQKKRSAVLLF